MAARPSYNLNWLLARGLLPSPHLPPHGIRCITSEFAESPDSSVNEPKKGRRRRKKKKKKKKEKEEEYEEEVALVRNARIFFARRSMGARRRFVKGQGAWQGGGDREKHATRGEKDGARKRERDSSWRQWKAKSVCLKEGGRERER